MAADLAPRLRQADIILQLPVPAGMSPGSIAAVAVHCDNPQCSDRCPRVGLGIVLPDMALSVRLPPDEARLLAHDILAAADRAAPQARN